MIDTVVFHRSSFLSDPARAGIQKCDNTKNSFLDRLFLEEYMKLFIITITVPARWMKNYEIFGMRIAIETAKPF